MGRKLGCAAVHRTMSFVQIARGGSSKKQSDQEKLVSVRALQRRRQIDCASSAMTYVETNVLHAGRS